MNYRFVFFSVVLAAALVDARTSSAAQEASVAAQPGTVDAYQEILAVSKGTPKLRTWVDATFLDPEITNSPSRSIALFRSDQVVLDHSGPHRTTIPK